MPYHRTRQDNWWERRTKLEKHLSCFAMAMLFLAVLLFVSLMFYRQYGVPKGVCLSSSCVHSASQILKKIDTKINPCEDFYDFACGGFMKDQTIPEDSTSYSSFSEVNEILMKQLRSILEDPVHSTDIHSTKVIKTYYSACMDEDYVNQEGLIEAQTLMNTLGGWPVLEEAWEPSSFNWIEQLKLFKEKGLNFNLFLSISAGKDFGDLTKRIIEVGQPKDFGLKPSLLEKGIHDPDVKSYFELMVDFAVMFGANDFKATEKLEEALNFEIELSRNIKTKRENHNKTSHFYKKMTLKKLREQYESIDWLKLFENILPENTKLNNEKEILVEVPSYVDALEKNLKNTPPETLANYMFWRAVLEISDFLPQRFEERILKFKKITEGISQNPPRWKKCLDLTKSHASLMLGAAYVRKFSNKHIKDYAKEIVKTLLKEFEKTIENEADWMDQRTKNQALEKAKSLFAQVAFADEFLDDNILNTMFAEIYVSDKLFLQSYLNINKHKFNRILNRLSEPVVPNDWREMDVPIVMKVLYHRLENSLTIPAAILQGTLFDKDRPSYLNYGGVGTIIGHEMVHVFDWWNNENQKEFTERKNCFIKQFDNTYIEEVKMLVSGERTLRENIADNEGTKQAYLAYNTWANSNGEENKLPGLEYTPRQLFWIAGAQNKCIVERMNSLKQKVSNSQHTPEKYRINENYKNIEYFAKDFSCPLNSKMNPQRKCSVW